MNAPELVIERHRLLRRFTLVAAVLAAAFFALSAKSSQTPSQSVSLRPTAIYIDAYGDSTMEGLTILDGSYGMTPHNEPLELERILRARFGEGVAVWNQGVSGSTLAQLIAGTDGRRNKTFQELMHQSAAHIVIENFGINDASTADTNAFVEQVDNFVTEVNARGKTPVLEEPNPVCNPSPATKNIAQIDANVRALERYAQANNVLLVHQYDYIRSLPNWQSMLVDCIHPSEMLYKMKAARLASVVARVIAGLSNYPERLPLDGGRDAGNGRKRNVGEPRR